MDEGEKKRLINLYEERKFSCQLCGEEKVRKRKYSPSIPKYCKECLKKIRLQNLKAAHIAKREIKICEKTVDVKAPDGYTVKLRNDEEKKFFEQRMKIFREDFEWTKSADCGLLSRLLLLEIEIYRLSKQLNIQQTTARTNALVKLVEEYRRCQQDLGVVRARRIQEKETESASSIVNDLILKFREYYKENASKFTWKCEKCNALNHIGI